MTIERSGPRALSGSNSDEAATAKIHHEWDRRRVLAVNLHNDAVLGREGAGQRLSDEFKCHGYTLDDVVAVFSYSPSVVDFKWPRNLSWKALPIVGDPVYQYNYHRCDLLSEQEERSRRWASSTSRRDRRMIGGEVELVVVAADEVSDRDLFEIEMMCRQDRPGSSLDVMHFDGVQLRKITKEEMAEAWEKHYPHDRFIYNHALNLLVLGARAYVSIARDRGEGQNDVETWMPQFHDFHWKFGHPLCAQVLFSIGRRTDAVPTTWFRDVPQKNEWLWANHSDLFFRKKEGDEFRWSGTGRYPAWTDMITPHVAEAETKIEGTEFNRSYVYEIVNWMSSLNFAGFVCLDQNGEVCLTTKGRRYMEIVAPALEDPDVLLRWRTEDGLLCAMKDVPSVDRWMNRAFRKLKRAVNDLPASPINEEDAEPWPKHRTNVFVVRGMKLDVTDEMRLDEEFCAEVARIEAVQASVPVAQWREGVVRRRLGFGLTGDVEHIWRGVPLAICADAHRDVAAYELLTDWKSIDEEIDSLEGPSWSAEASVDARLIAFNETVRNPEVFVTPARLMIEDEHTSPVIRGRVLKLDLPIRDERIAHVLKHQQIGAGLVGRQIDGIRIFGKGASARYRTVSVGVQVGAYDPRTQTAVLEPTCCELRSSNVDRYHGARKAGDAWECVFDHPDLSDEGYWIMLADGRTISLPIAIPA